MHNILRLLEYSAGVSAEWHHLAGYRNRRIGSITVRPFRFCNSNGVLYWWKIILRVYHHRQCLRRPPKHYCRGYRVPNHMGFGGSTALPFEDTLPVQPVILQASRYQGIRVNLTRAVVATTCPRVRVCWKLPLTKKLMVLGLDPTWCCSGFLWALQIVRLKIRTMSLSSAWGARKFLPIHMLCHLACPMSKRTLPLNKFLPTP